MVKRQQERIEKPIARRKGSTEHVEELEGLTARIKSVKQAIQDIRKALDITD